MKLEFKDYIAAITAAITVGSVVWKGGQITTQLEATNEAVKQITPIVGRLDATTARLGAQSESNTIRISDLTRRVEIVEARQK